ncbi:hypothetical protein SteCoe_1309 [Stentor coeruleus]|uniref:Uncharacterized protein n=1 Tax=Stentor coeruleus TaxID=5963 RepID=A0A1R2D283_9CILI|nr:hypothetical protein SteCoe_1309 [Stentor coeruleus]
MKNQDFKNNMKNQPRLKRPLKDTSILNVSKSILEEIVADKKIVLSDSLTTFIPFHNERDRVGRIIKENSLSALKGTINESSNIKTSASPINSISDSSLKHFKRKQSLNSIKKYIKTKKLPLKFPQPSHSPPVGTYNISQPWIKPSFSSPTSKTRLSQKLLLTEEKNFSVKSENSPKRKEPKSTKAKSSCKIKIKIPYRKKGVWEGVKISELLLGKNYTVEDSKKIVCRYDSTIKNSIRRLKANVHNLQKYL